MIGFAFFTVALFERNINGAVFSAWLEQELLPVLADSAVIVMDHASFHKHDDMIEVIEQAGHQLEYLLPYSPDINPIEKTWTQAKAIRRRTHCDVDTLFSGYINYDKL